MLAAFPFHATRLLKRAQSARISLPQRLRALSQLAQGIDQSITAVPEPVALDPRQTTLPLVGALDIATLLEEATQLVHAQILPRIRRYHVQIVAVEQLNEAQRTWLWQYFQQQIYPLLTPLAVDSGHPFPYLQSRRLNFLVVLHEIATQGRSAERYGVVQIPARLPRLIQAQPCLPSKNKAANTCPLRCLVWCEEVVRYFLPALFSGLQVGAAYQFRLLRAGSDPQLPTPMTAAPPYGLPQAPISRLDLEKAMPSHLRNWLVKHLRVSQECVIDCATPLALADLGELADHLKPQ